MYKQILIAAGAVAIILGVGKSIQDKLKAQAKPVKLAKPLTSDIATLTLSGTTSDPEIKYTRKPFLTIPTKDIKKVALPEVKEAWDSLYNKVKNERDDTNV